MGFKETKIVVTLEFSCDVSINRASDQELISLQTNHSYFILNQLLSPVFLTD